MIVETAKDDVTLVLGWEGLGESAGLRRNDVGFGAIKAMAEKATADNPLTVNAFLYAYLCPAKNFDLFLSENVAAISDDVAEISSKMNVLAEFERDALARPPAALLQTYLAVRKVVARGTARDERRTLATLLFSGPSTSAQVAEDLGIGAGLAERVFRALASVIEQRAGGVYALRSDTDALAAVLHLLRCTLGIDPISVLQRRISAQGDLRR